MVDSGLRFAALWLVASGTLPLTYHGRSLSQRRAVPATDVDVAACLGDGDVRFAPEDVRFTPESGHSEATPIYRRGQLVSAGSSPQVVAGANQEIAVTSLRYRAPA